MATKKEKQTVASGQTFHVRATTPEGEKKYYNATGLSPSKFIERATALREIGAARKVAAQLQADRPKDKVEIVEDMGKATERVTF
jgi:hypothetical protein